MYINGQSVDAANNEVIVMVMRNKNIIRILRLLFHLVWIKVYCPVPVLYSDKTFDAWEVNQEGQKRLIETQPAIHESFDEFRIRILAEFA
jgi:hypothetical protein